jgi:Subtilase family
MSTVRNRVCVLVALVFTGSSALLLAATPQGRRIGLASVVRVKAPPAFIRLDAGLGALLTSGESIEAAARHGYRVRNGRVQVVAVTEGEEAARGVAAWLEARGSAFVMRAGVDVQAWVDLATLEDLEKTDTVVAVRRPRYLFEPEPAHRAAHLRLQAMAAGSYVSEALDTMNVPAWHSAGFSGQGVKVGIIDSGFGDDTLHYDQLLGSDLPPGNLVHVQLFGTNNVYGSVHGLACAEVIYDIVPDAEMYLAVYDGTPAGIVNAIDWMRDNGVQVISMSQGWLTWSACDGTGALEDAINAFVAAGGVWANSAGNSRLAHWQGSWRDDNANDWLNFDANWEINYVMTGDGSSKVWLAAKTDVNAAMVWNEWSSPSTDLDFYLVRFDGTNAPVVVASSEDYQNGQPGQLPAEQIAFTTTDAGYYGFAVKRASGPTSVQIEFFNRFDSNPLQFDVQDGSVLPPADASGAIAAAALDALTPYTLQSYSSRGPANGPGGALLGGAIKPDIGGYANVSCNAYGSRSATGGFGGTSSAAPHVAGAAALVLSAYPSYTPAQVRSLLESRAVDMGAAGKDDDYGVGRLYLGAPPNSGCTAPGVPGGVQASASSVSAGQSYSILWTAAASADGYEVQEATSPSFSGASTFTTTATSRSFSHSPSVTTVYYYRVRATRTCNAQSAWAGNLAVTVSVSGSGGLYEYWFPVVASVAGSGGSYFYSDVATLNVGTSAATIEFRYFGPNGVATAQSNTPIVVGGQGIFRDVVGQLQEQGTKGMMEVVSPQPLRVTSRTYNQLSAGNALGLAANTSFGQAIEAYASAQALAAGQSAYLPGLSETAQYRTNIAVANSGTTSATVTVTLYSGSGAALTSYTVTLAAGELKQETEPFLLRAGQSNLESGWAEVTVVSGSGVIAYASVLDNVATGGQKPSDPTTVSMQP